MFASTRGWVVRLHYRVTRPNFAVSKTAVRCAKPVGRSLTRSATSIPSHGTALEGELIKLTEELLVGIATGDYDTYKKLCAADLTCFEPEAVGHLVEGLDFHKWYFELHRGDNPAPANQTIASPKVRMLGTNAGVVTYIRLQQIATQSGPKTIHSEETRVWELQNGQWKNVHFHRSTPTPPS